MCTWSPVLKLQVPAPQHGFLPCTRTQWFSTFSSRYVRLESGGQRDQCAHHPRIFQEPRGDRRSHREKASTGNYPAQTISLTERLDVCRLAGSNSHKHSCHAALYAMTRLATTVAIGCNEEAAYRHRHPDMGRIHTTVLSENLRHARRIAYTCARSCKCNSVLQCGGWHSRRPGSTARSKHAPSDSSPRRVCFFVPGRPRATDDEMVCVHMQW